MEKKKKLTVQQVKRSENLADGPSSWSKYKRDYNMDRNLFHYLLKRMKRAKIDPQVDMFASPGNHQLPKFVSRYPHWQAMEVDALKCPLEKIQCCYANPPWSIIGKWLHRLRENKELTCMMITPYWVSASWWPLLVKLQVRGAPAFLIPPYQGMFKNCWGEFMPPPRWPLICVILSEKATGQTGQF